MTNETAALDEDRTYASRKSEVYELDSDGIDTEQLAREIVEVAWDVKARNVVALDLRGRVSYTDFVIVGTGQSERHVTAIGRTVQKEMTDAGWDPLTVEGVEGGSWALLDFADVVVHVFEGKERDDYDLEGMWVDADRLDFEDRPEDLYGHFQADRFE